VFLEPSILEAFASWIGFRLAPQANICGGTKQLVLCHSLGVTPDHLAFYDAST
jgi:hypothetical protein